MTVAEIDVVEVLVLVCLMHIDTSFAPEVFVQLDFRLLLVVRYLAHVTEFVPERPNVKIEPVLTVLSKIDQTVPSLMIPTPRQKRFISIVPMIGMSPAIMRQVMQPCRVPPMPAPPANHSPVDRMPMRPIPLPASVCVNTDSPAPIPVPGIVPMRVP